MQSYKELKVWQKSIELTQEIYKLTSQFPKTELFGLIPQMRRSAVTIPSNIAEGYLRKNQKEYRQFLYISLSSAGELETQLIVAKKTLGLPSHKFEKAERLTEEVMKMLYSLIQKLS